MGMINIHAGDFAAGSYHCDGYGATLKSRQHDHWVSERLAWYDLSYVELASEENVQKLGSATAWGVVGGTLLGPAGLLAGLLLGGRGKQVTFVAQFRDRRKLLASTDSKTYIKIQTAALSRNLTSSPVTQKEVVNDSKSLQPVNLTREESIYVQEKIRYEALQRLSNLLSSFPPDCFPLSTFSLELDKKARQAARERIKKENLASLDPPEEISAPEAPTPPLESQVSSQRASNPVAGCCWFFIDLTIFTVLGLLALITNIVASRFVPASVGWTILILSFCIFMFVLINKKYRFRYLMLSFFLPFILLMNLIQPSYYHTEAYKKYQQDNNTEAQEASKKFQQDEAIEAKKAAIEKREEIEKAYASKTLESDSSLPPKPDLELLDNHTTYEDYASYIVGTIKNNTDRSYRYVQVEINLYNKSGSQIGNTLADTSNLEPGGTWQFKALITEENTANYKIQSINGF